MLFFVQMKWNYQGRVSQDKLWDLEAAEGDHGLAGIRAGIVQLYKVVSQHRIIAIVNIDSLEELDRNSMGWLPMREYLEFEQVWPLREYEGFIDDVRAKFPQPGAPPRSSASDTRRVALAWFANLEKGDFPAALKLIDEDVVWENIPSTPGVTDLAPWLGSYRGLPAVLESFKVWAEKSKMLTFKLMNLVVENDQAIGLVHEHAQCLANKNEYDLSVSTSLRIANGKIREWRVYWDPSPLVRAYRNM